MRNVHRLPVPGLVFLAALPVAAAGGLDGVVNLFKELYEHVSVAQDFHRQQVMSYLVQPVIGFILGLAMYFREQATPFGFAHLVGEVADGLEEL